MRGLVVTMLWILGVLSIVGGVGAFLVMKPWATSAWSAGIGFLAAGLFGSAIPLALAYIAESVFAIEERSQMNEIKAQRGQLG
jgi:hypothetical protein